MAIEDVYERTAMPDQSLERNGEKTIRVFISSTFRDMHAERDYLSRVVFPELRSRCLKRGAEFIGFDLRWGVTEEEAERQGALNICLQEIERCRPFFVCLLGSRYGWVPPPEVLPAQAYDQLRDMGALPPEIAEWYRLDETAVPPAYRFRRDLKIPSGVGDALVRFWEANGLPSAGESITAREILRGVFDDGYPATHALSYLRKGGLERHPAFLKSFVPVFVEQDGDRRRKLAALKRRIWRRRHQMLVRRYVAKYAGLRIDPTFLPAGLSPGERNALADGFAAPEKWEHLSDTLRAVIEKHGTVALDGMEAFGQQVMDDLWPAIEAELTRPVENQDPHQRERAHHERFVTDRTRLFLGRSAELHKVAVYLSGSQDRHPLVVTGEPGAGKSAFMAAAVRRCRERHPDALVVAHFIGAAPDSAQLPVTLRSLCETLRRELGLEEEVEADPLKLRNQLAAFLEKAGAKRTVVVFLDALNQLDPAGRSHELDWLPYFLPPRTKLVASTLEGDCLEQLRRRVPQDHVVDVPALPYADRRALVDEFLALRRKKLASDQLDNLLDTGRRPDAGLPLYLLVALEELCLFGDFQTLEDRIHRLPERLPELFDQVLARLEHDHGRATTESVCSWLAVARSGLLESEVLDLLGRGGEFPRIRWTRLYRVLEPYLKPVEEGTGTEAAGGRLDFHHDQLRFAVYRRYFGMVALDSETTEPHRAAHRQLAGYFRDAAQDDTQHGEWRTDRVHSLSELPYHQTRGEMWEEQEQTLCDLSFVEAKCAGRLVSGLVGDYHLALEARPRGAQAVQSGLSAFSRFVLSRAHILRQYPELTFQEAANDSSPAVSESAVRRWHSGAETRPWLNWKNRHGSASVMTLAGHRSEVTDCHYSPDGRHVVSASEDHTLRLWDADTGQERLVVTSGSHGLLRCRYSPDGNRIVSASWDGTVAVWDSESGASIARVGVHRGPVKGCAWSPDGNVVLSASADGTLRLWDSTTGAVQTITSETEGPACWAVAPDGQELAVCNWRLTASLKLFDLGTGVVRFGPSQHDATACAFSPDSLRIATVAGGRVKVCDRRNGDEHKSLHHESLRDATASSCAFSADGKQFTVAADNGSTVVWDVENEEPIVHISGQARSSVRCGFSPDGQRLVVASDQSLEVWDSRSGLRLIESALPVAGRRQWACSTDGRRILSQHDESTVSTWSLETGREMFRVAPKGARTTAIALSPNGRQIVCGLEDGSLRVLGSRRGEERLVLSGHTAAVTSCAYSPDGTEVASASKDHTVRLSSMRRRAQVRTLVGHSHHVLAAVYTLDGKRVVSVSNDGTIRSWDRGTGRPEYVIPASTINFGNCAFSPNGHWVAATTDQGTLKVFDVRTEREIENLPCNPGASCAFSPDGRHLLFAGRYHRWVVWDLENHRAISEGAAHDYHREVTACAFAPDGQSVLLGRKDGRLELHDTQTAASIQELPGHGGAIAACSFSPDGRRIASASEDMTVRIWESGTTRLPAAASHHSPVAACVFSPDGTRIASCALDGEVHLWSSDNGDCIRTLSARLAGACVFSPDGTALMVGTTQRLARDAVPKVLRIALACVRLWRVDTGEEIATIPAEPERGLDGRIQAIDFSPDGTRIVYGSDETRARSLCVSAKMLRVSEVGSRTELFSLDADAVTQARFLNDGRRIISAGSHSPLTIWDAETGIRMASATGYGEPCERAIPARGAIVESPDGCRIGFTSDSNTVRVWDSGLRVERTVIRGHGGQVTACAYSPCGQTLATACGAELSKDHTVRIWDSRTGNELRRLEGHTRGVLAVRYSPDGSCLLSSGQDGALLLWDLATGSVIAKAFVGTPVACLDVARAGRLIAAGAKGGTVHVFDVMGRQPGPPVVTAAFLYRFDTHRRDSQASTVCVCCGKRIPVQASLIEVIKSLARNSRLGPEDAPCERLPAEAWREERLVHGCPGCGTLLRLNPFIVDDRWQ